MPAHRLHECVYTTNAAGIRQNRSELLKNKHMRLMWIPHTDTVVVVCCNPTTAPVTPATPTTATPGASPLSAAPNSGCYRISLVCTALQPLRELLIEKQQFGKQQCASELHGMNFAQLRDELLTADPLDVDWVARVNSAEVRRDCLCRVAHRVTGGVLEA